MLEYYFFAFALLFFLLATESSRAICYYAEWEQPDQTFLSASLCCHVYSPPLCMLTEREAKQPWAQLIRISLCSALSYSLCQGKMFISSEKGRDSAAVSREVLFVCGEKQAKLQQTGYKKTQMHFRKENHLLWVMWAMAPLFSGLRSRGHWGKHCNRYSCRVADPQLTLISDLQARREIPSIQYQITLQ